MSKLSVLQKLLGKASSKAEMEAAEDILRMNPSLAKGESPELLKSLKQQELQSTFDKAVPRTPADLSAEVFEQQLKQSPNLPEVVGKVRSEIPKSELNKVIDEPKGFELQGKPYGSNFPAKVPEEVPEALSNKGLQVQQPGQLQVLNDVIDVTPKAPKLSKFDEMVKLAKANKLPISLGLGSLALGGDSGSQQANKLMTEIPPIGMGESLAARAELPKEEPQQKLEQPAISEVQDSELSQEIPEEIQQPVAQTSETQQLADLLAQEDGRGKFADILKHKNLSVLANQLGQAGNIIGGAFARTGPNEAAQKLFQQNIGIAQQGPEDFKQQIAMDEHDPDSAVSKNYRAFLEKRGLKVGPGITAAQIKSTLLPAIEKENLLKTKLDASKLAAIDKKAERELRNKEIDAFKQQRIDQSAQNLAKRQLESAKSRALSTIGGVAGNALRNRVVAANAMFGTVGVKEDITEQEVDKLKDVDLNKLPPQFIAELTVETNRMLTGSGIPAQSTFQKLMPKNLKMSEANIKNWVTSEMGPANQAAFAKLVLKTATRVKRNSQKSLSGLVKKSFSGTDHIKRQLPEDYENVIKELELNPEDFGFKPTPTNNVGIEETERLDKKSGKIAIFDAKTKEFIRYK